MTVTFGLSGGFLEWTHWTGSSLKGRTFSLVHGSTRSWWVPAPYGLPLSSVLWSLLYSFYTSGPSLLLAENTGPKLDQFMHKMRRLRSEEHTSELQSPDHLVC